MRHVGFRGRRGAALLMVVLVIVILSVLATEFSRGSHVDLRILETQFHQQRGRHLAGAGIDAAMAMLIYDLEEDEKQIGDVGGVYDAKKGIEAMVSGLDELWSAVEAFPLPIPNVPGGLVTLKIEDEQGKLNLNQLNDQPGIAQFQPVFDAFFEDNYACPPEWPDCEWDPRALTQAVIGWTDAHDQYAEWTDENYYLQLEPEGYEPRRGPIPTLSELRLVKHMDPIRFDIFEPYLTVFPVIQVHPAPQAAQGGGPTGPGRREGGKEGENPGNPSAPNPSRDPNLQAQQQLCVHTPGNEKWKLLNVNTMEPAVLNALLRGLGLAAELAIDLQTFDEEIRLRRMGFGRQEGPFADVERDFLPVLQGMGIPTETDSQATGKCKLAEFLTTTSDYFKITSVGILGEVGYTKIAYVKRNRQDKTVDILYQRDL